MKRTHKIVLGFFGLMMVAAMTVFAATIPIPEAQATTSFTDTITVTVVGTRVMVDIVNPENGVTLFHHDQELRIDYQNTNSITLTGVYKDANNVEHSFTIDTVPTTGDTAGTVPVPLNLNNYGYGQYTITAVGDGTDGTPATDFITFKYVPLDINIPDPNPTDEVPIDLEYDFDNVCSVDINVYLGNVLIAPPSPIHVEAPTTHVVIPLDKLESGQYTIVATPYDCPSDPDDEPKPLPFGPTTDFNVDKDEDIPVPDTGGQFFGMNISKTDYLLTAIIVFFAFGLLSLWIVIKGRRSNKRR